MELKNKKVIVVGMGKSGISSAYLLHKFGAEVKVLEQKLREEVSAEAQELERRGIEVKTGGYDLSDFNLAELVVLSPGVNERDQIYVELMKKGVEVIGELELANRFVSAPVIAVSGTDGKTTTVSLLGEIFEQQYPGKVWVGGNIGQPLADLVLSGAKPEVVILEVSSFQLAQAKSFHPRVGVMLNIAPDHLDRHLNLEDYYQAKQRLFMNQTSEDFAVLNFEDLLVRKMASLIPAELIWFGEELKQNFYGAMLFHNEVIYLNSRRKFRISLASWKLLGRHNLQNLLAAVATAGAFGVKPEAIQKAVDSFRAPAHRLEFVAEVNGVKYYDDSKGTTPHAVRAALRSFSEPVILLLGGRNKGIDFSELAEDIQVRARAVICFGESGTAIQTQLEGKGIKCYRAEKLKDAVFLAKELARSGEVVLLSPGCTSFDEFKNYAERGDKFQELVKEFLK